MFNHQAHKIVLRFMRGETPCQIMERYGVSFDRVKWVLGYYYGKEDS